MLLHRYFGSHADTTLAEQRLLLATASSFNDPFEFTHGFTGEYSIESALKDLQNFKIMLGSDRFASEFKKHLPLDLHTCFHDQSDMRLAAEFIVNNKVCAIADPFHCQKWADATFRICCFSKCEVDAHSEILLWSHYAKSHQGIRIEFELNNQDFLYEVEYSSRRCTIDICKSDSESYANEILLKSFRSKGLGWKYENEVRLILQKKDALKKPVPLGYRYYFPFKPEDVRCVDFGIKCSLETIKKIKTIIDSGYPHVKMRQAVHHKEDFAIDYQLIR